MQALSFDTESERFGRGLMAPPMACLTWCQDGGTGLLHVRDSEATLRRWLDSDLHMYGLNTAYDAGVCAAQFPRLMVAVFEAYLAGRFHDVGIDQRLIDIYHGELDGRLVPNPYYNAELPARGKNKPLKWRKNRYALSELAFRLWDERMLKGADSWQLRYDELIPIYPASLWPEDAQHYAIYDSVTTERVRLHQRAHWAADEAYSLDDVLRDSGRQASYAFALHLQSCRGVLTDEPACIELVKRAQAEVIRCRDVCLEAGLVRKEKGKYVKTIAAARDYMLGAVLRTYGLADDADHKQLLLGHIAHLMTTVDELPKNYTFHLEWPDDESDAVHEVNLKLTASGEISLDAEACKGVHDPLLQAYATYTSATSIMSKAKDMLKGARQPLQCRYQSLVETGRTSCSKPKAPLVGVQMQNFSREAFVNELEETLPGMRECVIARRGYVLGSIDLPNAEMRGLAQRAIWELGHSVMADTLNSGRNVHLALAAEYFYAHGKISYEQAKALKAAGDPDMISAAQFAKIPNFALGGGAAAGTMIPWGRAMKPEPVLLSPEQAKFAFDGYHGQWTEVRPLHKSIKVKLKKGGGRYISEAALSGRLRLIDRYTVGCNDLFQPLATGDAAKASLPWLAAEAYTGREYRQDLNTGRLHQTGRRSALYGAYMVAWLHDEVLYEFMESRVDEQAHRAGEIQMQAFNRYIPDVPVSMDGMEAALMDKWSKHAVPIRGPDGSLRVYGRDYMSAKLSEKQHVISLH